MSVLIDTGPLVSLIDKNDKWHQWSSDRAKEITPPFITCEAVISETVFLLSRANINLRYLFGFIEHGDIQVRSAFEKPSAQNNVIRIIENYHNLPASFADACLVAMTENFNEVTVFTLDSDFSIYRNSEGDSLQFICPE